MSRIYLPSNASAARLREAEHARRNRAGIVRELSWGRVTRRDLIKMGLFTAAGLLAPIGGLNPFVKSAYGQAPTGLPPTPLFGCEAFSQPMPRFDVLPRRKVTYAPDGVTITGPLNPTPTAAANETMRRVPAVLGGGYGPIEGRPPGPIWAHQRFTKYLPQIAVEVWQRQAATNDTYDAQVDPMLNSGMTKGMTLPLRFHTGMPTQQPNSVWTFNGTIPPKLLLARYGEPVLFRHHNDLSPDVRQNNGFGKHTIATHEHNGHHGAENDGFTGAYFFPGQFYDYHWPIVLGACLSMNTDATESKASSPTDDGTLVNVPGDWHETMSTHWFHDHMFAYTSQNVYKGNAAMFNIYSGLDRGNEAHDDRVNLCLPSGTAKSWGNLDYDVNLMLADKACDAEGQLAFDIFDFDGFIGDMMTVNLAYKPYFEVEARKYRFRILNASVSRFFKIALVDASGRAREIVQIANDGNLLPYSVPLMELDEMGIAERYDVVVDFSQFHVNDRVFCVNLADHFDPESRELNGKKPVRDLSVAEALAGTSLDPCVGSFLEFIVVREPAVEDQSQVPRELIPNPDLKDIPVARERVFEFGRGAKGTQDDPWGIKTDKGDMRQAEFNRVSAAPRLGTREIWTLRNGGGGWDHPIHIHFEEGQILERDGSLANVPAWERGRKDVYRLRPSGTVKITMQFRDWGGMFMEHCHNTVHEDHSMLLRWEIDDGGAPFLRPLPSPKPTPQGVTFEPTVDILPTAL